MQKVKMKEFLSILVILSLSFWGCIGPSTKVSSQNVDLFYEMDPKVPSVDHPAVIKVSLMDKNKAPIRNAAIQVEGNMSHPGMVPVFSKASEAKPGFYNSNFKFTMKGDWIISISAAIPDGSQFEKEFYLRVEK
jgi:hypothetical protein